MTEFNFLFEFHAYLKNVIIFYICFIKYSILDKVNYWIIPQYICSRKIFLSFLKQGGDLWLLALNHECDLAYSEGQIFYFSKQIFWQKWRYPLCTSKLYLLKDGSFPDNRGFNKNRYLSVFIFYEPAIINWTTRFCSNNVQT